MWQGGEGVGLVGGVSSLRGTKQSWFLCGDVCGLFFVMVMWAVLSPFGGGKGEDGFGNDGNMEILARWEKEWLVISHNHG